MMRTDRWTIALVFVVTALALSGCLGSDASSEAVTLTEADARTDSAEAWNGNADDGDADGQSDADEKGDNANEDTGGVDEKRDNADDEGADVTATVPSSMSFSGCDVQVGVFDIPAPLVADKIPPGFEPTSALQPAGPTASVIVDAHACGNATSDAFDGTVEDVGWVIYLLAVDPPDEYEDEDVDFYFIPVASVSGSSEVADVYAAWNFSFEEGTVDLGSTITPEARTGQLEVQSENISSTLRTAVSSDPAEEDPSHKGRWFQVSDGEVTSIVEPNVSASSRFLGSAERVIDGSSDPGEVPFWAWNNAKTTGVGLHFVAEQIDVQQLDPDEVAGS